MTRLRVALMLLLAATATAPLSGCAWFRQEPPPVYAPPPVPAPLPQPPPPPAAPPPAEVDLWPAGRVPLCFQSPLEGDAWAREAVMGAADVWEAVAKVEFDIRAVCDGVGDKRIPIRIEHDPEQFASASHLGVNLVRGGAITLNADYLVTNRICGRRGSVGREGCFRADALHELGHALGFSHDHVSPRAPDCVARTRAPEAEVADEDYYDAASIMNYCNPERWLGRLSEADVCSVRAAYGAPDGTRPTRASCYAMTGASLRTRNSS